MPQSRHRKLNKAKKRPRVAPSGAAAGSKSIQDRNKIIAIALIVLLVAAAGGAIYWTMFRDSNGPEITTKTGLKYREVQVGTGAAPQAGQSVSVHYTGTLTNGFEFDSSTGKPPYTFRVGRGEVIAGWDEAILGMKVGGKRKLIIPPELGYRDRGFPPDIPPNATLLFDVELVDVK